MHRSDVHGAREDGFAGALPSVLPARQSLGEGLARLSLWGCSHENTVTHVTQLARTFVFCVTLLALGLVPWGMVPHLLRIGRRQNHERRSRMAEFHGDGRLLPEWPASDVDRLVRAALAALVSCRERVFHARARTRFDLGRISAEKNSHRALFRRHSVADWHHPHGKLYVSQLSRSRARVPLARRPVSRPLLARTMETANSQSSLR